MTDHLSEYQRHGAADGLLSPSEMAEVSMHIAACAACRADLDRIEALVRRLRDSARAETAPDPGNWSAIRARIEQRKVVSLGDTTAVPSHAFDRRTTWTVFAAAVFVVAVAGAVIVRRASHDATSDASAAVSARSPIVDSTTAYRDEAQRLMNRLALQRATLRPETAAAIDSNLKVIDAAIAELQDALTRDPNDPALRRLLASSYREKVDLLKRLDNAS